VREAGNPQGPHDSILNKTSIAYKANRKVGGYARSLDLPRLQQEKQVGVDDAGMDALLASHALAPELLRRDDFDVFLEDRRRRLSDLVARAMDEPVSRVAEADGDSPVDEYHRSARDTHLGSGALIRLSHGRKPCL